jgi:phosphatidylglycerophosphate synthase
MTTRDWRGAGRSAREPAAGVGAQIVLLGLLWAGVGVCPVGWLAATGYAVVVAVILTVALLRSRARSLGPAGRVTLARAVLVGGVTALVTSRLVGADVPAVPLVALGAVALALDAVDGKVARRTGTVSALGARFDMEVDAFLILVLSVDVALSAGPWVLAIGLMRYAFGAAAWAAPWLRAPLPPSRARKVVASVQGVALLVAASGLLPGPAVTALTGTALVPLTWSFGRDVAWLWRRHHDRTGQARSESENQ